MRHEFEPHDRWAIVAYVRSLQESQGAKLTDIPDCAEQAAMRSAVGALASRAMVNRQLATGVALLVAAEGLLAVLGLFVPIETPVRGWLVAFAAWSLVPIGSMVLLLIHHLTGGEWGYAAAPVLRPAAAMVPLIALAFVPVLIALPEIYPWATDPSAIPADVARWYLNQPSFLIRAVITLGGWSLIGIVFAAGLGSRLLAGLGLAFFGLTISFVAVDWYLSLEPHYVATAFAAMIAIQQLLAALGVAAVIGAPAIDGKVAGDLGAFLIATLLGVVYLEFMTFVVAWYGDLPEKSVWFLERSGLGWISVLITAILTGAVLPFALLLVKAVRRSRLGLRIAGGLILFGTILHVAWLLVPAFDIQAGTMAFACAGIALLVLISLMIGSAIRSELGLSPEARHAE